MLEAAPNTRAARDATRGGVASALNEMADAAGVQIEIDETTLPLRPEVKGVCEVLGLDPLYLANEGTLVLFVPADEADAALAAMKSVEAGRNATAIGTAKAGHPGRVTMKTLFGGQRLVGHHWSESNCPASVDLALGGSARNLNKVRAAGRPDRGKR